ncbi:MAG: hypothetical protein AB1576_05730 [Bacillota bacterium]
MESRATVSALSGEVPVPGMRRGRGRNWTPEEDRTLLWLVDQVRESPEPVNVTAALQEAAGALGRTPVAVRARYYRLAGDNGEPSPRVRRRRQDPGNQREPFLENLSGFLGKARKVEELDLEGFVKGLHTIASLAAKASAAPGITRELEALREEKANLEAKVGLYEEQMARMREQYETLDYLVKEFINLSSVDKVTSLGDFGRRLKYQVDQFGTVMKVERV